MKRQTLRGFCLAVCIGAGSTAWWLASPAGAQQGFSLKSLRGEYVFALDGYTIQGDTGQHQPFAWAGKETYDGAGHVAGVFTASYNGEIVHRTYTGTYTVNPDGTGSTLLTDSNGDVTHFDIFIRKGRDEVSYVETDPGVVSSGYERRSSARSRSGDGRQSATGRQSIPQPTVAWRWRPTSRIPSLLS